MSRGGARPGAGRPRSIPADDDAIARLAEAHPPADPSLATSEATGRPQDQGRSHRRKGAPSPETRSLLTDYRSAMRGELRATLDELAPVPADPGLGLIAEPPKRPAIETRIRLWDLAIKLGRELGAEVDEPPPATVGAGSARPSRRARVDFGP